MEINKKHCYHIVKLNTNQLKVNIMNKIRINAMVENFKYTALDVIDTILWALDGKFGRKVLKPKYRRIWRCITWGSLAVLTFIYVIIPILNAWQRLVDIINYVRWGC